MTERERILAEIAQIVDEMAEKAIELQENMRNYWDEMATENAETASKSQ